jgi:hypothetical protein
MLKTRITDQYQAEAALRKIASACVSIASRDLPLRASSPASRHRKACVSSSRRNALLPSPELIVGHRLTPIRHALPARATGVRPTGDDDLLPASR